MRVESSDGVRCVNIGDVNIWKAIYSTIVVRLKNKRNKYSLALSFFETGMCKGNQGYDIARQINLIRDDLSQLAPDKAVYKLENPKLKAPWSGNISPVITSCANLFTTADGQDLLYELVSILCYAKVAGTDIVSK